MKNVRSSIEQFCDVLNNENSLMSDPGCLIQMGEALETIHDTLKNCRGIDDVAALTPADMFNDLSKEQAGIILMSFLQWNIDYFVSSVSTITGIPRKILSLIPVPVMLNILRSPEVQAKIQERVSAVRNGEVEVPVAVTPTELGSFIGI